MTGPSGILPPQPWMRDPRTQAVMAALAAGGAPARYVGGCVRDAVAGRPVKDVDIATPLPPDRVLALVETAGLKAVPTGIAHGTVTAVSGGRPYEITTLRRDVDTDGRHATVAFTDDWEADAARRDLTFNALFMDPDGRLYDFFGGLADLEAGRVRFIGDPRQRLCEDVLRLLRFFRFLAWYGKEPPAPDQLAACRDMASALPRLSGERVQAETLRLLEAPDPAAVWRLMQGEGVVGHVLADATDAKRLDRLVRLDHALGLPGDAILRLAALLPRDPDVALAVAARLKLSNAHRDRLVRCAAPPTGVRLEADERDRRRALHHLGSDAYTDLARLAAADETIPPAEAPPANALRAALAAAADWTPMVFPLKGKDALARGVPPGPEVGRLLGIVERWWEERDYRPDRAACLSELERRIAAG
ncbi:MAG TPA: CCA tRNA nucleotidyltransferase [Azospirillaceae bacterium]|nr:CCA tRNA nucleotidyltransferase [Azospirillaceae bacterium]